MEIRTHEVAKNPATKWGPNIQNYEPLGSILIQTATDHLQHTEFLVLGNFCSTAQVLVLSSMTSVAAFELGVQMCIISVSPVLLYQRGSLQTFFL